MHRVILRRLLVLALLACGGVIVAAASAVEPAASATAKVVPDAAAEALAERMLQRLGGRTAWAGLRGTINDSLQNRLEDPTVIHAVIAMDFTAPRFRIDSTAPGIRVARVIDGDRDWRLTREGEIRDLDADLRAEDLRWYQGHVYRTLHRVAARDPALSLRLAEDGRLEVLEHATRIFWFRLDAAAEPYSFGAHDDEQGTLSGPWAHVEGDIRHPVWVSNRDGTWRARLTRLELNPTLPDSLFERPESNAVSD
ncbi:MAG: hypothetical protein ACT4NL_09850 [Pseudomarimonas sp.]